jgi:undecaprenyl-diphosphatase
MIENIILGIVQGIAEWLPVSSEGVITLIKVNFFNGSNIQNIVKIALFLHLGTFLAALVYLRKEVWVLLKSIFSYKDSKDETKKTLWFLIVSTIISGGLGFGLYSIIGSFEKTADLSGQVITFAIGLLLLITAWLQIKKNKKSGKHLSKISFKDGLVTGIAQGLAVLPGLSRSGLTVSTLLLRGFDDEDSLRLSFLMSLPMVLAGNLILNLEYFKFTLDSFTGFLFSFIFGILTIHILLKIAKKINMGYFVLFFGIIMMLIAFI